MLSHNLFMESNSILIGLLGILLLIYYLENDLNILNLNFLCLKNICLWMYDYMKDDSSES